MSRERFEEVVCESIVSLPQDMKAVLRIVEDPDISDESRAMAAGALLHVLSAQNAIPGQRGILGYVDDALVLRLTLERIEKDNPEAMARHREDSPELFADMDDQLAVTREFLGDLVKVLDHAVDNVAKISHQGHNAKDCAGEDSTWLYDSVQEAVVDELDFDEDEVARECKQLDKILPHLRTKAETLK